MKKRKYESPSWGVIEMRQGLKLLQASEGGLDPLAPFTPGNDPLNS